LRLELLRLRLAEPRHRPPETLAPRQEALVPRQEDRARAIRELELRRVSEL